MKKLIVFCLLLTFFSHPSFAQKRYERLWNKVENYELDGRSQSALEAVDKIYKKAKRQDKDQQFVKAFLYKAKYELILKDDIRPEVYRSFKAEISARHSPVKQVLSSVLAESLWKYYQRNSYKVRNRSTTASDSINPDFETWNARQFEKHILRLYQNSLDGQSDLLNRQDDDYAKILKYGQNAKQFQISLFDVLARRYLTFITDHRFVNPQNDQVTNGATDRFLVPSEEFVNLEISTRHLTAQTAVALHLFQQVEQAHIDDKDKRSSLYFQFQRMDFIRHHTQFKHTGTDYVEALNDLKNNYSGAKERAWIAYKLADFYRQHADKKRHPEYYKRALDQAKTSLGLSPKGFFSGDTKLMTRQIGRVEFSLQTKNFVIPDRPSKALLRFRNTDTVHLTVFRIKGNFKFKYRHRDSLLKTIMSHHRPVLKKRYVLPGNSGHFQHSTEILLPQLSPGRYLTVLSKSQKPGPDKDFYTYNFIQATTLAYTEIRRQDGEKSYFLTDRENGNPLKNVKVEVYPKPGDPGQAITAKTNIRGLAQIKMDTFYDKSRNVRFTKAGDSLLKTDFWLANQEKPEEDIEFNSHLLTDRGIYRPGQPLYVKGILSFQRNKNRQVVDSADIELILTNANNHKVATQHFTTNAFGSFHGKFNLPKSGLNGEYSLHLEPEFEKGSKWDRYRDDFQEGRIRFKVEDYKRPTFDVQIDSLQKTYVLGDTVTISGKGQAFFGGNLDHSKVHYTVERQVPYQPLYRQRHSYVPSKPTRIKNGTTTTDAEGDFTLQFTARPDSSLGKKFKPVFNYTVKARITDINGETRTAKKMIVVGYHAAEATILVPDHVTRGDNQNLQLIAKDLNGRKIKSQGVLKLYRLKSPEHIFADRPWDIPEIQRIPEKQFRKLFPHQAYDSTDLRQNREKILVKTLHITSQAQKTIALDALNLNRSGDYWVTYKGKGPKGFDVKSNANFHLKNPREAAELPDKFLDVQAEVKSDKNHEWTLTITYSTPLDELYVLTEVAYNKKLHEQKVIHLKKGITQKQVNLPKKAENIYVQTFFEKANSFESRHAKVQSPKKPENKLHIETLHVSDKLTPGNKETWELKVLDHQNKPVDAEVLASMYDASLDDFTFFKWHPQLLRKPYISFYNSGLSRLNYRDNSGGDYSKPQNRPVYPRTNYTVKHLTELKKFGYDFVAPVYANKNYLKRVKRIRETQKNAGKMGYGRVQDANGLPLPGVTVSVVGTDRGTQTDFNGYFYISAQENEVLQFSFVGYKDLVRRLTKPLVVTMNESIAALQAVTVNEGYNEKSMMAPKNKADISDSEIINALQGKVPGLKIGGNSGQPGREKTVMLRGRGSSDGQESPLFVIDGVPVTASEYHTLALDEISNVDVLKGSAATSLYGNRATNGAVAITTKTGKKALENIKPRENLQETVFFCPMLKTDKNGDVRFSFTSPEALTRWKFQAFAHNKDLQQGYVDLTTVTQKNLNIIPNFPRYFRSGDTVVLSAKINNLSKNKLSGIAKLQFKDEIKQKNIRLITDQNIDKPFQIRANGNIEVHWTAILPVDLSAVRYKITAKSGDFTDGQTDVLPVLSNRLFVTETEPIWVNPGEEKSFTLKNLKNNSSSSLQHHRLIFDYTTNPAWTALRALPYLMEFPHECSEQTFARYYANTLSQRLLIENPKIAALVKRWQNNDSLQTELENNQNLKNILLQESPWLKTAAAQKDRQKRLAELLDSTKTAEKAQASLSKLKGMQLSTGGFPWFKGGRANTAVSVHILTGLGRLGTPKNPEIKQTYDDITTGLLNFLDGFYLKKHRDHSGNDPSKKKAYTFGSKGLHYLYARGPFTQKNDRLARYKTKALRFYEDNWLQLGVQDKILLAVVARRSGKTSFAKKIINSLKENAVINSNTGMYWKTNTSGFGWHQDPIETQALAIELFSQVDDQKSVRALKTWLLRQKQTQAWKSTKATTDAIYALLLKGDDLHSENASPQITIGDKKLNLDKTDGQAGEFKKEFKPEEISPKKATVHVKNDSNTPQYGGLYWQYFENSDAVKSSNLPELQLKKGLFINREGSDGKILIPMAGHKPKVGDLITVRLTIHAKTDFEFMHLKDMRAAGFEPVDVISKYRYQDGLGYYESTKDAATHFFFDRLPKGTYVFEYELRVSNPGEFSNGITQLQSMYAPEFSVQSRGRRVEFKRE